MSLNSLKKMMIFSDERTKLIVEKIVADEAAIEKRSASAIIEKHILNDLLPKNQNAAAWIRFLYDGSWEIGKVLETCFAYLSSGINCRAKYDNALAIVKFAHHLECMASSLPNAEAKEMHHFLSQFDSVVEILENTASESPETTERQFEAKREAKWAKDLYNIAKNKPEYMLFSNIYQLILNNWEHLRNSTFTYRLLADLAAMQTNWTNNAETRLELARLIKSISDEWNE